jgi:hypothetical protein
MKASIIGGVAMAVILGTLYFVTHQSQAPTEAAPAATEAAPSNDSSPNSNFKL